MNSNNCSQRSRDSIPSATRRALRQHSGFSCSLCGNIPIVVHHIDDWASTWSNHDDLLITICLVCHEKIHGKGDPLYSRDELLYRKSNPVKPSLVLHKITLEHKKKYTFFMGSNYVDDGETGSFIKFPNGDSLVQIDTTSGKLVMTILAGITDSQPIYLMEENELKINVQDIWDMDFSGGNLRIEKMINGKKQVFIDLILRSDVIIIRKMKTIFNGKSFTIRQLRKPQGRQVKKIESELRRLEEIFLKISEEIDISPKQGDVHNGIDFNKVIKNHQKDAIKKQIEDYLRFDFSKNFSWDWGYYVSVLDDVLRSFPVFRNNLHITPDVQISTSFNDRANRIRDKHRDLFNDLDRVVAEYNGFIYRGNIMMSDGLMD